MNRKLLALSVIAVFGSQSTAVPQWLQVMEIVL